MKQYIEILKDCQCEHANHEIINYPREELKRYYFKKGKKYPFIKEFTNFYGKYYSIKTPSGYIADIFIVNGKLVEE